MTDTPTTPADEQKQPGTELTVAQRASLALGAAEHEKALIELAKQSTEIVAITNPAGLQQCHSARMALKTARVDIEKRGKAARDDATKFSKAVIEEERRLIGLIEPEEKRLQGIQDAHEAQVAAKKAAAAAAEAERVARIQSGIRDIKNSLIDVAGRSSAAIEEKIRELVAVDISPATCQEFAAEAETARTDTLARLREMHANVVAQEAEAANLRAQRAELERQQREQEARQREIAERAAAEQLQRQQEDATRQRAFEAQQAAMSEITGIQQQVIIAQIGRLGVRVGGTIACIEETLAETEAWPIDADRFGVLTGSAQAAKDAAIASIRALLETARAAEAEAKRVKEAQEKVAAETRDLEERQKQERDAIEARDRQERLEQERQEREQRNAQEFVERQERERIAAETSEREAEEKRARDEAARLEALTREEEEARQREIARKATELLDGRELLATFKGRFGHREEFAVVTKAIDVFLSGAPSKSRAKRIAAQTAS